MMKLYIVLVFVVVYTQAAPAADEVTSLPGLGVQLPWKHYSGYLKATGTKHLHYWFVESASNPSKDPLVLWLNGGPGCSSLLGLLTEHGPFRISKDGSEVTLNEYSWNNLANMIYLESPAGVGFSYADDKNYTTDDDMVIVENYVAVKDFFTKFPEYASNDFYVAGESYAGIYVPTLSSRIIQDSSINFKGMAIGNAISNFDMNDDSLLYFAYHHGLIGDRLWNDTLAACCPDEGVQRCHFVDGYQRVSKCSFLVGEGLDIVFNSGLNVYNLYAPCLRPKISTYVYNNHSFTYNLPSLAHQTHPIMKQKLDIIRLKRQFQKTVEANPPCLDHDNVISYLNMAPVKNALHISPSAPEWEPCSDVVSMNYTNLYRDVTQFYVSVLGAGKQILVYNGDIDMMCNFLGDEWFVEALNLPVVEDRTAWYYKDASGNPQVAGFVKKFRQLTLTTIRGSGHMVPEDKPVPALLMFSDFLNGSRGQPQIHVPQINIVGKKHTKK